MKVSFIYGAHNVLTPRRFVNTSQGMIRLDHGATCGMESELAEELSKKLRKEPKVPHQIILVESEDALGDFSNHYSSTDAIEIVRNIYAPAFVNQFCQSETRQEVIEAKNEQLKWIARELTRVKDAA